MSENKDAYTIKHNRPDCIGCAACEAVAPDFWEMKDDSKSSIKGGNRLENGQEEKGIEEKDLQINKDAADSCPVNVIHIVKADGEQII
ncbi:MAG: ferredoxin [Candidatus Woesearchaeota archaeon]|jgi:ferredoxin|nr:ferredoxin [Candidatus Woesearchaeota archaeon]MDP7622604.1 ferredoxin [Candidatus Woesearchaeota archaeon]HJN57362.1 ferredoxin [Candidatus Woesearchaeota archaeon]|tara:strand:- start:41223 stop:41486 length:264 start_codon:yes stop_codon:yes gene_type:complete